MENKESMRITKNNEKKIYLFLIMTIIIIFAWHILKYGTGIVELGVASFISSLPSAGYIYVIKPLSKKLKIIDFEE